MSNFFKQKEFQPIIYSLCVIAGLWLSSILPQQKGKLNDIFSKIDEYYVDDVDLKNLQETTINALLENLDPHSYYLNSEQVQIEEERMIGNFDGIGVEFKIIADTICVLYPIPGGPSAKAGIKAGDKLIQVEDKTFVGDSITSELAIQTLRGKSGSPVKLKLLRGDSAFYASIIRGKIPIKSVDVSKLLENGTAYIKINRFAYQTVQEFDDAINKMGKEHIRSLIIDVRENPGGLMESVVNLCKKLLPEDKMIVYTKGRSDNEEYKTTSKGEWSHVPVVILIDENSASASEILAGAIQDNDRGWVVGRRSFGKGLVQRPFELLDGSNLRLTISRYYTPVGRCIQKDYSEGKEAYLHEQEARFLSGELLNQDSIPIPDSLIFTTPKGKKVYGGGGIFPDIFIPIDTIEQAFNLENETVLLADQYLVNHFSYWESKLINKSVEAAYVLLEKQLWLHAENYFVRSKKVTDNIVLEPLKKLIQGRVLNKIMQNSFGENGYFYSILTKDKAIEEAKKLISEEKLN